LLSLYRQHEDVILALTNDPSHSSFASFENIGTNLSHPGSSRRRLM